MINNELIKLMENINIKEVPKNEHSTKPIFLKKFLISMNNKKVDESKH